MLALIDGDIIKYQAGFASDQTTYLLDGNEFDYKKDAVAFAKLNRYAEDEIEKVVVAEPVEYCLSSVKKMIKSIMEAVDANECRIFLTGKDNFREEVAITAPYKGNRDDAHKPIHYNAIQEYLIKYWNAEVVEGQEADDALGIAQYKAMQEQLAATEDIDSMESTTVICTIDKDLDQIIGWHYNWKNSTTYWIGWEEAENFFYRQLLTGDTVDNILGCGKREEAVYKTGKKKGQTYMKRKGIGPKQAEKLLPMHKNEEEMYKEVRRQYKIVFEDDAERALRENADLLWILREKDTRWIPPNE